MENIERNSKKLQLSRRDAVLTFLGAGSAAFLGCEDTKNKSSYALNNKVVTSGSTVENENVLNFSIMADLVNTDSSDGTIAVISGYHNPGDGGGGVFFYDQNNQSEWEPNGGTIVPAPNGCWVRIYEGPVNVKWFGAHPDASGADNAAAIQSSIDYIESNISIDIEVLYFPAGTYRIDAPLSAKKSGNYIRITGGHRRSATLKASYPMDKMLTIGQSDGVFSRLKIDNIRFDCNDISDTALDLTYCRYSDIHNNEFTGMKPCQPAIIMSRWVNRIYHNEFNGCDSCGNAAGRGILLPKETTNDLQIFGNSISNCSIGIECLATPHDVKIFNNTFDVCSIAAIYFSCGGRNIQIENNYFERCGDDDSDGVEVPGKYGASDIFSAPIIAHWSGNAISTLIENLVVKGNEFANCKAKSLGLFSDILGLSWRDNHALKQYNYNYTVRFVVDATGQGTGCNSGILIDQRDYDNQFNELVELGGPNMETFHSGFQLIWRRSNDKDRVGPVYDVVPGDVTDPKWNVLNGSVSKSGSLELNDVFAFSSGADIKLDITINSSFSLWLERYFRVCFLTKGTAAIENCVWCRIYINTGSGFSLAAGSARFSNDGWIMSGYNMPFFVPRDAVALRLRLTQVYDSDVAFLSNFHVDSASVPPRY